MTVVLAWLRRVFLEGLGLKLLSMLFALGLFAFLHGQQERQQRTVPVGLVLRLPPESAERELMTSIPASIHVTLQGATRALDQLMQSGVPPVEVDLRAGTQESLVFDASMLSLPREIKVGIIDPPGIPLEWQDVVTRRIPLQASITGKPAEGYVVRGEPEVEPTFVTVRGPTGLLETLQFVRLAAFDVAGLTEGVHRRRIAMDSPPNRVSTLGPPSATVAVTIARRVSEVKFPNRPVEVVGTANGHVIPRTVDVTILGPPEVVRALRPEQVVPRANVTPPAGQELARHDTKVVEVTVDLARAEAEIQPPTVAVRW